MAYATAAELAAVLGVTLTAGNTDSLTACLDAAAQEIDHCIDAAEGSPTPADDPLANRVNLLRGVEWWKANQSIFGVVGMDEVGTLRAPRDGFGRHRAALVPLWQQWGVA